MSLIILPRLLPPGKRPATAVVVDTIGLRCTLTIILGGSSTALMPDPAPFRASLARVALPFAYVRATSLHTGRRSTNDASTMVCPEFATDDAAHGGSAGPSFWPSSTTKARHHGVSRSASDHLAQDGQTRRGRSKPCQGAGPMEVSNGGVAR
ncbi:hypothetical protein ACCO45_010556 [Purpureocillium lilacinum]|uniref:Uncharacterized protein n=1 Tax=Purpureocillium lilacinum TaxID=33203 RepID=A0ACC4DG36_PURLI